MNQIQKMLFYAGISQEDYLDCLPEIRKDNRRKLRVYLIIACCFLMGIFVLSGFVRDIQVNFLTYGVSFSICFGLLAIEMAFPENNGFLLKWMMYAFAALLYTLGIIVALRSPDELSVSFVAFLLAVPLLFVMPPIQHILNIIFFELIFILCVVQIESGRSMTVDIIDSLVFGTVSCIISTFMMISMHQNFVSSHKLAEVANYDVLTGMKNRNAYETDLEEWPRRCQLTLSCVYVDVNGLHELNNTKGHNSGDQMLQTVSYEMRMKFGTQNCYRIGGDEFVTFVQDEQDALVRSRAEEFEEQVQQSGYSVAVGVATRSAGEVDIAELIRLAEKRMYLAKAEHYRAEEQDPRINRG